MIRLPIEQVDAGMRSGMPVHHPHHEGTVLLKPGAELSVPSIDRLRGLGLPEMWVHVPGMDGVAEHYSQSVIEARAGVSEAFEALLARVRGQAAGPVDFTGVRSAVERLVRQVESQPRAAIYAFEMDRFAEPLVRRASALCYLSILIGHRLGFYLVRERARVTPTQARDLVPLGLGALLADLGLARAPEPGRDGERAWADHARDGYELVKGRIEPAAASTVLHHHQRWNGTGFPQDCRGDGVERGGLGREIHVFARIVAAADQFLALRMCGGEQQPAITGWLDGENGWTPAMPVVRALRRLQSPDCSSLLDTVVTRALVNVVPAFAPGEVVTLSDGREGVVSSWSVLDPCRPVVAERVGPAEISDDRIDLRMEPDVSIAFAGEHDVRDDIFAPKHPRAFDLEAIELVLSSAGEIIPRPHTAAA